MTRLFWTLIALFPLPLVILLIAGPPELFEREKLSAVRDVAARLEVKQIDWSNQFGGRQRVNLTQILPEKAEEYERFDMVLVFETSPDQPVLVTPTGLNAPLRYRLADACWDLPAGQLTWMRAC